MEYLDYKCLEYFLITEEYIVTESVIGLASFLRDNKNYFDMIARHLPDMLRLANSIINLKGSQLSENDIEESKNILESCKSDMENCYKNNKLAKATGALKGSTDESVKRQIIEQIDKNSSKLTKRNKAKEVADKLQKACDSIDKDKINSEYNDTNSINDTDKLLSYFLLVASDFIKLINDILKLIKRYKE